MSYKERIEAEREEEERMATKMMDVANILQEENVHSGLNDDNCSMRVVRTDRLFMRFDYDKSRIEISGNYPRFADGNFYRPDTKDDIVIRVSADKTAGQIAKDIQRRFLPAYQKCLDNAMKRIKECDANIAAIKQNIQRLGLTVDQDSEVKAYGYKTCELIHGARGVISVSPDSVSLDIGYVSVDKAAEILAILRREE